MENITGLKKWLKRWEHSFVMENKRRPTAEDIRNAPEEVVAAYKRYADAKRDTAGSVSTPTGKMCLHKSSEATRNQGLETESVSAEMTPWGAELNKKDEMSAEELPPKEVNEANVFMQSVGHKLLAKANLSATRHCTRPSIKKDDHASSHDESATAVDSGHPSEPDGQLTLFGKAANLTKIKQTGRQTSALERHGSPHPPGVESSLDESLPQNIIWLHQSRLSKSAKCFLANSRLTTAADTVPGVAGDIQAEWAPELEDSNTCVNDSSQCDRNLDCLPDSSQTDLLGHGASSPVSQPSGHSETGHENTCVDTNRSKRKASGSLDANQNKKRMIHRDHFDTDHESESGALVAQSQPEVTDTTEALTRSKNKTSQRKPAVRSIASNEGNYVRLNMKVKKYQRKGFRAMTGGAYKRQAWKKRMQGRQGEGQQRQGRQENSGNKCFKCGQPGHWAKNCKGGRRKMGTPVDMEDAPTLSAAARTVDDALFPTMNEAIRMSRGIRMTAATAGRASCVTGDSDEEELAVVRSLDDTRETPSAAQPLYQLEEDGRVPDATPEVYQVLKRFGFDSFRPGQEKVIMRMLCGLSTLVVLSTGAGKSLCYQLPAFMYGQRSKSITLVISPLVSLMDDQVMGLPPGVNGACLHTNLSKSQRDKVVEALVAGAYHFLLISPETLVGSGANSTLPGIDRMPPIAFACIDEVHCVSEWSHHFRPSYLRLCKVLKERYGVKCILGLTATATMATIRSISHHLGMSQFEEATVRGKAMPDNLHLSISRDVDKDRSLVSLLSGGRFSQCQSIIIYCTRRQQTEHVACLIRTHLQETAPPETETETPQTTKRKKSAKKKVVKGPVFLWTAESYHAGLTPGARRRIQKAFMSGSLRVVVATVAFGMGLDKSDVRGIIHYTLPKSFESYVQEIGRAGRDGEPAFCHAFLDREGRDMNELKRHIYSNTVDRSAVKKLLREVFLPCRCREAHQKQQRQEGTNHPGSQRNGRLCPGHERAIPIAALVQKMDMKEEGIDTLLCYLELHEKRWLETLQPVYATCTLTCYGGAAQLQAVARKCPPVAVAIATEKRCGTSHAKCSRVEFAVVELSDRVGWSSGLVKRELKQLEWSTTELGLPRKSGVLVEFSDLAFHLRSPGDLTDTETDKVTNFLVDRLESQEAAELRHLQLLYDTFYRVSHTDVWMCMDEVDEDRSSRLKRNIFTYFDQQSTTTPDGTTPDGTTESSETGGEMGQLPPVLFKVAGSLSGARADIGTFISLYGSEHRLSGRAIARVFHGIPSPCFPAEVWGRVRRFWRSYLDVDFNVLRKLATQEVLRYK